jgi:polyisoprenoid-binding protein YceI
MHAGAGQFWGRFNDISGTFTLSDDPAKLAFMIDVAIDSVDSGNDKLDGHLKSPDFFNAKEFPKMSFKSTGAKKAANGMFEVMGELTMHGVTKPITAMVEITGQSSMMGQRGGAEATFTVKRSEFGMNYGVEKGMIGDMVKVVVGLEGVVPTK